MIMMVEICYALFKPGKYLTCSVLLVLTLQSCNRNDAIDFATLEKKYSRNISDSLKLQSLLFIKKNIDDVTSEKIQFYNAAGRPVSFPLDTITSDQSLELVLLENGLYYKTYTIKDIEHIDFGLLEQNIEMAVEAWQKYPWNKNVPKDIFLNYLLPYKVLNEDPKNWRQYFSEHFTDSIKLFQQRSVTDPRKVNSLLRVNLDKDFHYSERFNQLTISPSLTELLAVKKGECYHLAHLFTYVNRAVGIPGTIDLVPLWGAASGGHAADVFYQPLADNTNKDKPTRFGFKPIHGSGLIRPPKVFRMSFKKVNLWTDSIRPLLDKKNDFVPEFLKSNHLLDVTDEYTNVGDLTYNFMAPVKCRLAYICVYNYGEWKPLFYGKVRGDGKLVKFNSMAKDMAYHIAIPKNGSYELIGKPFIYNSLGNLAYSEPQDKSMDLIVKKVNVGTDAWIKKDYRYNLMMLVDNKWKKISTGISKKDSIINFYKVPTNAFYILKDVQSKRNLERIFLYRNGEQIWY